MAIKISIGKLKLTSNFQELIPYQLDKNRIKPLNINQEGLKGLIMEGIQYVTNEKGERIAVQIDLRKYGELWEDVYDTLIAQKRAKEPRESLDSVKARLIKQGKLNG